MRAKLLGSLVIAGCIVCGLAVTASAGPRTYQTVNVITLPPTDPPTFAPGGATLFRSKQAVEMRIATSGLAATAAYTVWWVVFNNPAACSVPCGVNDLGNPEVRASVFYAAGFVTGLDGTGNVSAHMEAGALPLGIDIEVGSGLEPGNGFGAEIHMVVRTHGGITLGSVDEQIGSFNGGCAPTCANQQAAVFAPVE
jgi:hypothetical protein